MALRHMVKCYECGYTVYSRAHHDMNHCKCGKVAVDGGGAGYVRVIGDPEIYTNLGMKETGFTNTQLYTDWNLCINLLGCYPDNAVMEMMPWEWEAKAWKLWKERTMK